MLEDRMEEERNEEKQAGRKEKGKQVRKITLVTRLHTQPHSSKSAKFDVNEAHDPTIIDATTQLTPLSVQQCL